MVNKHYFAFEPQNRPSCSRWQSTRSHISTRL